MTLVVLRTLEGLPSKPEACSLLSLRYRHIKMKIFQYRYRPLSLGGVSNEYIRKGRTIWASKSVACVGNLSRIYSCYLFSVYTRPCYCRPKAGTIRVSLPCWSLMITRNVSRSRLLNLSTFAHIRRSILKQVVFLRFLDTHVEAVILQLRQCLLHLE